VLKNLDASRNLSLQNLGCGEKSFQLKVIIETITLHIMIELVCEGRKDGKNISSQTSNFYLQIFTAKKRWTLNFLRKDVGLRNFAEKFHFFCSEYYVGFRQ